MLHNGLLHENTHIHKGICNRSQLKLSGNVSIKSLLTQSEREISHPK